MRSPDAPVDDAPSATPARRAERLAADTRQTIAATRLQLLCETRHQLALYLPILDGDSYACAEDLAELRRIAISGRRAQIRILLHDPAAALRHDHRLIALAQRLPTAVRIRSPVTEADLAYVCAYLFNDTGGYLVIPEARLQQGRAARQDTAGQAPLKHHFESVWARAEPASALKSLNI